MRKRSAVKETDEWRRIYEHLCVTDPAYLRACRCVERHNIKTAAVRERMRNKAMECRQRIKDITVQIAKLEKELKLTVMAQSRYIFKSTSPQTRNHAKASRRKAMRNQELKRLAEYVIEKKKRRDAWIQMVKDNIVPKVSPPAPTNALRVKLHVNAPSNYQATPKAG